MNKLFFIKRTPEPRSMEEKEMSVFEAVANKNYKMWFELLADNIYNYKKIKTGQVLDIACGPGFLTKALAKKLPLISITGFDISASALAKAEKNCKGLNNVSFKKGTVYKLPFKDNTFELVVCRDSFHHFDKPEEALSEMKRVLKKGGKLYIQDLRRDVPDYLLKKVTPPKNIFEELQYYSVRAAYLKTEMAQFLKNTGFAHFKVKTKNINNKLSEYCRKNNIPLPMMKASMQSHYIATATVK